MCSGGRSGCSRLLALASLGHARDLLVGMLLYKKTRSVVLKRAGESVEVGGWDCACVDYCESEFLFCSLSPPILSLSVFRIVICDVIRAELLKAKR